MPAFPQYLMDSFLCLLLFAAFYRWALAGAAAFREKRSYLRLMPAAAFGLPAFFLYFIENQSVAPDSITKMAIEKWLTIEIPEFNVSIASVLTAVFFLGFAISAFRLVDRFWAIWQFLNEKNNRPGTAIGWQVNPTARFSQLFFLWEHWSEDQKNDWASKWLPIHPVFGWEVFLVEMLCALNWWNPVMHWYRRQWPDIYRIDFEHAATTPVAAWKLAGGLVPLVLAVSFFVVLPAKYSPVSVASRWTDEWAGKIIFEHKKPPLARYTLRWGDFSIPLKKYANPNGFAGSIDIELTDFQQILKKEIKIYRGEELLKPGTLSVLYRSGSTAEQAYINDIDPNGVVLKDRRSNKIYNDQLSFGDELVLFGETEDIYLSRIRIKITDPNAGYEPVVNVPDIDHHDADFSFQIVGRTGKRALVKVDTGHPNAWRILELYQDSSRYEIVKIPGFRTNRRYLTENETLLSRFSAAEFDLAAGLPDVNYLPEYQDYQNQPVSLRWGGLEAAPSSENYTTKEFSASAIETPELWIGEIKFKLEAFEIIIAEKNGIPFGYRADGLDYFSIRHALDRIQPETSVYFDRIVVKDEDGVLKLFPAAFAFHVGKKSTRSLTKTEPGRSNFIMLFGDTTEVMEVNFPQYSSPVFK